MTPTTLRPGPPLREKWLHKITVTRVPDCPVAGDCWLWSGADNGKGYGVATVNKRGVYLHRFTYELYVGPITAGLHLDHLCRQPSCCAPYHLEPVTCLENVRRGRGGASRTHCPQGHEYSGENLYIQTDAKGRSKRVCRTCRDAAVMRHRERHRVLREQTWVKYAGYLADAARERASV